ncbi:uncharacterized protein [Dendropsophus ebraccatus]|uniref:uncharacterized protein isoform X2 n=1 Tax=Dendropsophus ebraccatus TaxID=150705 RepID=UPI0038320CE6
MEEQEDLARRLCEAVENEDAREVENLLKNGADPNLILPTGIAAIHLASGKESECALRCLTLILQHSGNPNVRSTDDLTPVHVAASWGCCKALIFLLRKGGDPTIQDQDGNTALDFALMENNRRCVVTLQEYKERVSDQLADEIHGCHKNCSSLPDDDIIGMSCITLLLESTYKESPLSSTKISLMSVPQTVTPVNHMDDTETSAPAEMYFLSTKGECRKEEIGYSAEIMKEICELKPMGAKGAVPVTRTLKSNHCSESNSTDITLENSPKSKIIKTPHLVDHNCETNTRYIVNEASMLNNPVSSSMESTVQHDLKSNRVFNFNHSTKDFNVFGKLGLDVTSPDHAYTYSKECIEDDMDKTLIVCGNTTECEVKHKYSDCNTSLWNSGDKKWVLNGTDSSFKDSNGICSQSKDEAPGLSKTCTDKTMNVEHPLKEDKLAVENEELTGAYMPMVNSERKGILTAECTNKTARSSEMQCISQSPTLPVEAINSQHDSQDLQVHLRKLLLSIKGCHRTGSKAACAPVSGEPQSLHCGHTQKDVSSSSSSAEDTLIIESHKNYVNEKGISELNKDLNKMMLATKNFHSPSTKNEEKSPFFTPRSKSRLHSFRFRQNSSSLFEDSVEMPKRGRRVRSPDGLLVSSTHPLPLDELPSMTHEAIKISNTSETLNHVLANNSPELTLTNTIPQNHREEVSEAETSLSIGNFLTDDLSSETEKESFWQSNQTNTNHCTPRDGISDSVWLTEDGESEISGVADCKNSPFISSTMVDKSLCTGSFFHSTLVEDRAVNGVKAPRYSFSRLSYISKADESSVQRPPSTIHDCVSQHVPLSPGGRPVNLSQVEPVEYVYKDNEKGHVLIEKHMPSMDQSGYNTAVNSDNTILYDWRNYKINTIPINHACSVNSPSRVARELYRLSNDEIASRLRGLGKDPGQVTSQNRKLCILLLDKLLKEQTSNRPAGLSFDYSPELCLALHTFNIPDCNKDEAEISREFDQPDKTLKWREGVLKSSFNYLLLDPRVTRNLPSRYQDLSQLDCFRTFISAVFYVGKGKRSRPYSHLYEALTHYKGSCKQVDFTVRG